VDGIISISQVNVEVTHSGAWRGYCEQSEEKRNRLDEIVRKADKGLFFWSTRLVNTEDASDSLLFAAHMGSTCQSLWSTARSEYFTASREDLTPGGLKLYETIRTVYGIDPLLITCLDT
jgi:hypothetical protein